MYVGLMATTSFSGLGFLPIVAAVGAGVLRANRTVDDFGFMLLLAGSAALWFGGRSLNRRAGAGSPHRLARIPVEYWALPGVAWGLYAASEWYSHRLPF